RRYDDKSVSREDWMEFLLPTDLERWHGRNDPCGVYAVSRRQAAPSNDDADLSAPQEEYPPRTERSRICAASGDGSSIQGESPQTSEGAECQRPVRAGWVTQSNRPRGLLVVDDRRTGHWQAHVGQLDIARPRSHASDAHPHRDPGQRPEGGPPAAPGHEGPFHVGR